MVSYIAFRTWARASVTELNSCPYLSHLRYSSFKSQTTCSHLCPSTADLKSDSSSGKSKVKVALLIFFFTPINSKFQFDFERHVELYSIHLFHISNGPHLQSQFHCVRPLLSFQRMDFGYNRVMYRIDYECLSATHLENVPSINERNWNNL